MPTRFMETRAALIAEAVVLRAELELDGADEYELSRLNLSKRKADALAKAALDRMDGVRPDQGWTPDRTTYPDPTPRAAIRNILKEQMA